LRDFGFDQRFPKELREKPSFKVTCLPASRRQTKIESSPNLTYASYELMTRVRFEIA